MDSEDSKAPVRALILDSDILIEFLAGNRWAAAFLENIPRAERNLSVMSCLELVYGCRSKAELRDFHAFLATVLAEIVPVNENISHTALKLMERSVLSRRPDLTDVLIAATALERGEALASGNERRFRFIPGPELKAFRPRA